MNIQLFGFWKRDWNFTKMVKLLNFIKSVEWFCFQAEMYEYKYIYSCNN